MRKRRICAWSSACSVMLTLTLGVGGSGPSAQAAALAVVEQEPSQPSMSERRTIETRKRFGLNAELKHVRGQERAQGASRRELGIPLSPAEVDELSRRQVVIAALAKYEREHERDAGWAGQWFDNAAGGVVHVAYTRSLSVNELKQLDNALPGGTTVEVSVAEFDLDELSTVAAGVGSSQNFQLWADRGVLVQETYVDTSINRVVMVLPTDAFTGAEDVIRVAYAGRGQSTGALVIVREDSEPLSGPRESAPPGQRVLVAR